MADRQTQEMTGIRATAETQLQEVKVDNLRATDNVRNTNLRGTNLRGTNLRGTRHSGRPTQSTDIIRRSQDSKYLLGGADIRMAEALIKKDELRKSGLLKVEETHGVEDAEVEHEDTLDPNFIFNHEGLTSEEAKIRLERYGKNELPEKIVPKWYLFVSQFWAPMPLMIWAAILIELIIANYVDMVILLIIQLANGTIGFYELVKAGNAVAALKASLKPTATVKRDGSWGTINANLLVPGDLISLGVGCAIPADCRVNEGELDVDQAALTGESLPVTMFKGDSCKMGSTVVRGEVEATVEFTGCETFFGKTASLLGGAPESSNLQKILIKIMIVLVALSGTLCTITLIYLIKFTGNVTEAISFVVVVLIASIPLAMEIVTTTTLAVGSRELSHHGAIVSRLAAVEDLAGMAVLCSDKTGTLTLNKMVLQAETPVYFQGETQYSLLRYAAMAAKWKEPPKDALDTLTLNAVDLPSLDHIEQVGYLPFDPIVKRTEGTLKDTKTGEVFKTTKGAPHVLLKLLPAEDDHIRHQVENDVKSLGSRGMRCLAVARTLPGDMNRFHFLGLLTFLDPPRPDTKDTIFNANKNGVAVKMITGDHLLIAKNTAIALEMGDNIQESGVLPLLDPVTKQKPENLSKNFGQLILDADGFAQVFPEHKYLIVECLREMGYKTGMTGDGVNDAPALKRADVGIAVQGATDAAKAAADIVLTRPGLSTIVDGILIARCVFMRIRNFITYRVAATLQLLFFFFIAVFALHPKNYNAEWDSVFKLPVLLVMCITVLNDATLISIGYDTVYPPKNPVKWNLKVIFSIGAVLGSVACIASLVWVHLLLDNNNPEGLLAKLSMNGLTYGQIICAIYMQISITDFLTLFSSRTGGDWLFAVTPSKLLLGAAAVAISTTLIIALSLNPGQIDKVDVYGLARRPPYGFFFLIIVYCLIWWFVQDVAKVLAYRFMTKHNIFDINDSGMVRSVNLKKSRNELKHALLSEDHE